MISAPADWTIAEIATRPNAIIHASCLCRISLISRRPSCIEQLSLKTAPVIFKVEATPDFRHSSIASFPLRTISTCSGIAIAYIPFRDLVTTSDRSIKNSLEKRQKHEGLQNAKEGLCHQCEFDLSGHATG
jgi:hypothetical protein